MVRWAQELGTTRSHLPRPLSATGRGGHLPGAPWWSRRDHTTNNLRSKHTGATVNWGPELQPFSLYNYFHEDVKNKKTTLLSAIIPQGCPALVGLGSPPFWNDAGPQHRCLALCSPSPRTHSLEETLPVLKHIHPRAGVHTDSLLPCLVLRRKVSKLSNSLTWTR